MNKVKLKLNLPNRITLSRILVIPVYMVLMYYGTKWTIISAGILFIAASITDSIDGYIARKNNMVTDLGKFLDPLADKLLVLTAVIILLGQGRINSVPVVVITGRELIVMSLRTMAALKNRVLAADVYGKIKTIAQLIAISAMHFEQVMASFIIFTPLVNALFFFSVVMTVLSGINYVGKNLDVISE
ncbi:MAG: CDP-diacylglycerol--glycerol-3-phosphate 3-phosphatidyltransferase [Eubacteriaceae bacterium]|nr:CDP-diacylglycerol--glycerol-3-phosphate 3-phosphatidyltransferase [Eubacteriaceae bacterium]